ncbi:hydroxymethylglutaryl-CoA reductase, degradative [Advenella mimigardefordensis]|uniref:3-hydroxy-3-methylglutaryl coenzyme A reductase n=1 Tax=Advenella mimigardefordensis (strain DSM 17166 / LMG 22922 / DPN7) TaxID=1247726 RepID=W0PBS4_ADVMD|nr:hydroxymethylglutaryl-CoA reductase, degradative [Advenella mimigardefordensis]AHG62932.1 3-hydroxy-3-methylglutaryl-coenzyme A reductase [Advenella mimigardefordensis DPN7]
MSELSSRIAGFHKLGIQGRLDILKERCNLDPGALESMLNTGNLPADIADHLIENVITTMNIPVGVATNMKIDGTDVLVPMATEESSVVAAVCNAARQCYENGGFITSMSGSQMIAQIQLVNITSPQFCRVTILEHKAQIKKLCDDCDPILLSLGGGLQDIEVRVIDSNSGPMVITHLIVDTRDAMGANAVNTMAEKLAPLIEQWTGGKVYLRILSNLADKRLARARATWTCDAIGGEAIRDGIMSAYHFAKSDPYRAATHNKGIMNGVSAVVLATGNDTRAVEAGAHAYAARDGHYGSLTHWEVNKNGDLVGSIEIPMAVGLIGGATKLHPTAKTNLQILGVKSANQLARIIAATGLAQNFAALKALATTGIQKGHMALHAQNVAMMAGAVGQQIDQVANALIAQGTIRIDVAQKILQDLKPDQ